MSLPKQERSHYLDWLRVLGMIAVFFFHCSHIFDPLDFHVKNNDKSMVLFMFVTFCNFWLMPLFFLVAGAASRFAAAAKTTGSYLRDRLKRLVIPFIMGVIVLVPPQDYVEQTGKHLFSGTFLEYLPKQLNVFVTAPHTPDFFGSIGHHTWFLAFLFLFSVIALPVFKLLAKDAGKRFITGIADVCQRKGMIYLFAVPLALNYLLVKPLAPEYCGWADFVNWLLIFVYGFILMSEARFPKIIQNNRIPACIAGIVSFGAIVTLLAAGQGLQWYMRPAYSLGSFAFHFLWVVMTWSWLIFFLGVAQKYLNYKNKFLAYANEAALPFYLLHQTVVLLIASVVVTTPMNLYLKFLVISSASLVVIMALYELVVKRINLLRFLFGMKPKMASSKNGVDNATGILEAELRKS